MKSTRVFFLIGVFMAMAFSASAAFAVSANIDAGPYLEKHTLDLTISVEKLNDLDAGGDGNTIDTISAYKFRGPTMLATVIEIQTFKLQKPARLFRSDKLPAVPIVS